MMKDDEDEKLSLKGFFVCDNCACYCSNGCDDVGPYGPDMCVPSYFPRKQKIGCLGPYCDTPCELQKAVSDVTFEQYISLIMYLGKELNTHLIEDEEDEKYFDENDDEGADEKNEDEDLDE